MEAYSKDRLWPLAKGSGSTLTIVGAVFAAIVTLHKFRPSILTRVLLALASALSLLILYFFRDPPRNPVEREGVVVSAADGEVVEIAREREQVYLKRDTIRISVFLSIMDVHVQRVPISGTVRSVTHRPGKFLQAFRPEASTENEHIAMLIETPYGAVLVKQIAGILARRCVNYARTGDELRSGQRFGLIRFGSRVDLFLPPEAEILVNVGDKVTGGLTTMARMARSQ